MKTVIIDYDMGNVSSVQGAFSYCGGNPIISRKKQDLESASHIVLPGVGSFAEGMKHLRDFGLDVLLQEQVQKNKIPFLGICLGMQLLATEGLEGDRALGLNFIEGKVVKLEKKMTTERIPHVGWNEVHYKKKSPLLEGILPGKDFYFSHSYHMVCPDQYVVVTTPYGGGFASVIQKDNIFGVQFHPEKSQQAGFALIKNFLQHHA